MERPRRDKLGVCAAMKAPVGLLSHKAVLRKQDGAALPRQTWRFRGCVCSSSRCSGARWLGLSNRLARTEYHSRLVLSTLILQFFRKKGVPAGVLAFFLHSAQRKPLALAENPLVFYSFLQ